MSPKSPATPPELDPIIAELVRARKAQGLSQQAVADMANISRRALQSIEAGGDCSLSTLRGLCRALDVELEARPVPQPQRPTLDELAEENRRERFGRERS